MSRPRGTGDDGAYRLAPALAWALPVVAIACLAWLLVARVIGPSDLWDQTQPRTVSYTSDIIANGRWWLPVERGEFPATKPPLYNWMAMPAVRLLGFSSEFGHKFPSVLALSAGWLMLVLVGRGLGPGVGWLSAMMFVVNYTMFKLGYLARPDMLLTLWLLIGWGAATATAIADGPGGAADAARERGEVPPGRRWLLPLAFWLCVGLAGLTKGPPALTLIVYALIAGPILGGGCAALRRYGWWWGVPLAMVMVGAWIVAVGLVDPEHLRRKLWYDEIWGRVTGVGPEGGRFGPLGMVEMVFHMPLYYLGRFAPWSVISLLAVGALWARAGRGAPRCWRSLGTRGAVLQGAALFVIVVILFYTLSSGKRADYVAGAFAPGALLASWWLLADAWRRRFLVPVSLGVACAVLTVMTVWNEREDAAPTPGFGDAIMAFAREARPVVEGEAHPVAFCWTDANQLQAMVGFSERDGQDAVFALLEAGEPFWVFAGRKTSEPHDFGEWLETIRPGVEATARVRSAVLPRGRSWPEEVSLFLVEP